MDLDLNAGEIEELVELDENDINELLRSGQPTVDLDDVDVPDVEEPSEFIEEKVEVYTVDKQCLVKYFIRALTVLHRGIDALRARKRVDTYELILIDLEDISRRCHVVIDLTIPLKQFCDFNPNLVITRTNTEKFREGLQQYMTQFQESLTLCMQFDYSIMGEDDPDEVDQQFAIHWYDSIQSIIIVAFTIRIALMEAGNTLRQVLTSPFMRLLQETQEIVSLFTPEVSAPAEALSQLTRLCSAIVRLPVASDDVIIRDLRKFSDRIKEHSREIRAYRDSRAAHSEVDSMDSSSSDEPLLGASGAHGNELVILSGVRKLCKVSIAVIEDVVYFIDESYDLNDSLCWNCYGVYWLESVSKVARAVMSQIRELKSIVTPPRNANAILSNIRYLRMHVKALIDVVSGLDQFQESKISSSKQVFKTGHHWAHKMNRRLAGAFDSTVHHLYG